MTRITAQQAGGMNRVAFLDMIAQSEIGQWLLQHSDDGYNILVGSYAPHTANGQWVPGNVMTFPSYAAHPDVLNAKLNSTAAGRYQLLYRYFLAYQSQLKLPDFSPVSQDLIALQQIRECEALPLIDAGNFGAAVLACNRIWASLTGSPYGQHTNPIGLLQTYYQQAGGALATA